MGVFMAILVLFGVIHFTRRNGLWVRRNSYVVKSYFSVVKHFYRVVQLYNHVIVVYMKRGQIQILLGN